MATCPQCLNGYPQGTDRCPVDGSQLDLEAVGDTDMRARLHFPRERAAREATDPLLGTLLAGKFRVLARIGAGGMGVVYEATHTLIGKPVALKVLHERFVDRPEVAARLMNEARLASAIHNEHIVDIFDFGETSDGRTFVVMELLQGESLAQRIRENGGVPAPQLMAIAIQVGDALGAAHDAGIIHRDVKPENVFLLQRDGADFVKVLDFGISKAMHRDPTGGGEDSDPDGDGGGALRLTQTGMVLGTPMYMSPEQARGAERIDHRVDVYALGVILYEALTGEVPFTGKNYLSVIGEVIHKDPPPPREVRPDLSIPAALEQVVRRAMAKDLDARYPTMAALTADLRRIVAGEVVKPQPAPRPGRPIALFAAIAGLSALILAATVFLSSSAPRVAKPEAPPPPAPQLASGASAPAPAIIPAAARILIDSSPPGATITRDGVPLGTTPFSLELAVDAAPVRLEHRLEGHEPGAFDVSPDAAARGVRLDLRAVPIDPKSTRGHSRRGARGSGAETLPAGNPYLDAKPRR